MQEGYLQVTTTTDSEAEGRKLAELAVEPRAAGGGLRPIPRGYWGDGKVENAQEWMVLLKTTANRVEQLIDRLRAEHSYDTPEIVAGPIVSGNPAYLDWITAETSKPAPD